MSTNPPEPIEPGETPSPGEPHEVPEAAGPNTPPDLPKSPTVAGRGYGFVLGAGLPIFLNFLLVIPGVLSSGTFMGALVVYGLLVVLAIALTVTSRTRLLASGLWIGLAVAPIVNFGVCVASVSGSGL